MLQSGQSAIHQAANQPQIKGRANNPAQRIEYVKAEPVLRQG